MQFVNFLGFACLKTSLALVAIFEFSIIFAVDFSKYEHDKFILLVVACMTLFCLFRVSQAKRGS
jgi:hypothetical protein